MTFRSLFPGDPRMKQSRRKSNDKPILSFPKVDSAAGGSSAAATTDTELMNELVAACGRNDKAVLDKTLFDLKARHEPVVLNVLRSENVPAHDRDLVSGEVWKNIARIARKAPGSKGAWNPDRGRDGGCPFVPLLKDICSSRARDYHRTEKTQRRRRRRIEEAASTFGAGWRDHGGAPLKADFPQKRGGNLKQTQAPAAWNVVAIGKAMLPTAMAQLEPRERQALELHAEGLNNEEIAKVVKTSPATVSRDLTRARAEIRRKAEAAAG